jgi:hypothetical protein
MNTAKHWRKSNWLSWRKRPSFKEQLRIYAPTMIFASWLGTYLDLVFIQKQLYSFPMRPFSDLFDIHVLFTLFVLPVFTALFLHILLSMNKWPRRGAVLLFGILAAGLEHIAEKLGWFTHSAEWQHYYSIAGYILFMWVVWKFHHWIHSAPF